MKFLKSILLAATLLITTPAYAASTAAEVVPGFLTTSGCVPSTNTPCFLQFSVTNPMPVSGSGGGGAVVVAGSTSNAGSGVATSSTNIPTVSYNYGFNGTTWDQLQVDGSKFLKTVISAALPAGSAVIGHVIADSGSTTAITGNVTVVGATSNAGSGVATSSTNASSVDYLYGFNGTTWDQLQVDGSKFLKTVISAALPAGSAVIGHVIADSGSTTAVTGNVTVIQGTGTNLHVVTDSGTITTVSTVSSVTGGATSNASDAVATGSVSIPTIGYGYAFNGTTWDRLQDDGSKNLKVLINGAIAAGTNLMGKVGIDQTTVGTTNAVSLAQLGANTIATGNGTSSTGTLRVAIASDNTANSNPFLVQPVGGTANGNSNFILEAAASDNHTNIKNGAGTVYSIDIFSKTATVNYFRLYNAGTGFNGCNSATNIAYEGITVSNAAGGLVHVEFPTGMAFATGISLCFTGAFGQTDTTAATASSFVINVGYK